MPRNWQEAFKSSGSRLHGRLIACQWTGPRSPVTPIHSLYTYPFQFQCLRSNTAFWLPRPYLPASFCAAAIKHWPEASWEGKGLFHLTAHTPLLREAEGRGSRQTEAETPEECCVLTCPTTVHIDLRSFCLNMALPSVDWALLCISATGKCPTDQSDGGNFSIDFQGDYFVSS